MTAHRNAFARRRPSALFAFFVLPLSLVAACSGSGDGAAQASAGESGPYASEEARAEAANRQQAIDLAALGFNEGSEDTAPVRVIEFSDFGCVHCANFHMNSYHPLHAEFIETGDVVWKYVPITIGGFPNGDAAGITGECAGQQGRFARMRDHLFANREEWIHNANAEAVFRGYAEELGLQMPEFEACYRGPDAAARIAAGNRIAGELGVRGTPTFVIQGFPVAGAPPLEQFREALQTVINEARAPGGD